MGIARTAFVKHLASLGKHVLKINETKSDGEPDVTISHVVGTLLNGPKGILLRAMTQRTFSSEEELIQRYELEYYERLADELSEYVLKNLKATAARRAGGDANGVKQIAKGEETRTKILLMADCMQRDGENLSGLTKKIAREMNLSVDHVRKIRKAHKSKRQADI